MAGIGGSQGMDTLGQFRTLVAEVDPKLLTHADRAALIDLIERALEVKVQGGGGISLQAFSA